MIKHDTQEGQADDKQRKARICAHRRHRVHVDLLFQIEYPTNKVMNRIPNSLDAQANRISIEDFTGRKKVRVIQDNGNGTNSIPFDEYPDFAAIRDHRRKLPN